MTAKGKTDIELMESAREAAVDGLEVLKEYLEEENRQGCESHMLRLEEMVEELCQRHEKALKDLKALAGQPSEKQPLAVIKAVLPAPEPQSSKLEVGVVLGGGQMPCKGRPTDSGWDVFALEDVNLPPMSVKKVRTGFSLVLPKGVGCMVRGRSGMNASGVFVAHGTVDQEYVGEVGVVMWSIGGHNIKRGDKIAQLVFERVLEVGMNEVGAVPETSRGANGFGSSGR